MRFRNRKAVVLMLALMLVLLCGCSAKQKTQPQTEYRSIEDLAGKRIGILTGTKFDIIAEKHIDKPQLVYFNGMADCPLALDAGKIDAYVVDEPVARALVLEYPGQRCLAKPEEDRYGFVFPKTEQGAVLRNQFNEYLAKIKADGTLEEMDAIWFGSDESLKVVDVDSLTGENGTLQYVTESGTPPFDYVQDGKLVGYEVDLAVRFCREYGYALEMSDVAFAGLLASISSGKSDFGASCISITEERKESLLFSEPDYIGGIALVVRDQAASANEAAEITGLEDLEGKRIALLTGSVFDTIVPEYVKDPQFVYFNTGADCAVALDTGKADAYITDEPIALLMLNEYPDQYILERITEDDYAMIVAQTDKKDLLLAQLNEFITKAREDGTLDEMKNIWFGRDQEKQVIDFSGLTAENGTLLFATSTASVGAPFAYISDGKYCGYDIDLAVRFCRAYGYGISIEDTNFSGMLASMITGKADFSAGCVIVTEERRQSGLLFTEPNCSGGAVFVVRKSASAASSSESGSILDSFEKTFLREDRWKLFAGGIGITLLITFLTTVFGTALGFLLYLVYRKENRIFNGTLNVIMDILEKTPVVVILMILYYVVFGSSDLDGVWVAIVGFSFLFACGFVRTVDLGVRAIDKGQSEASLALGFTDTGTFLNVILPQAARHFLPNYRGNIVSLLKDTAIVGYIAVQDLTKVGDIVRSRTYEAFFPLIATAVIYFLLAWLLTLIVSHIEFNFDSRNRSAEKILKGVKTK